MNFLLTNIFLNICNMKLVLSNQLTESSVLTDFLAATSCFQMTRLWTHLNFQSKFVKCFRFRFGNPLRRFPKELRWVLREPLSPSALLLEYINACRNMLIPTLGKNFLMLTFCNNFLFQMTQLWIHLNFQYEFSVDKHFPKYLQHEIGAVKSAHRIISIN